MAPYRRFQNFHLYRCWFLLLLLMVAWWYICTNLGGQPGDCPHRQAIPSSLALPLQDKQTLKNSSHAKLVELMPRYQSYWLLETSGRSVLIPRELCAIESTALHNYPSPVYVLVTSPTMDNTDQMDVLHATDNIHVRYLDLDNFLGHSRLSSLWTEGSVQASNWPVSHLSDILRYLLLATFGGTYLDTDVIVLRSLNNLTNFVGREYLPKKFLAPGIMNFEHNHPVIHKLLDELEANFRGDEWGANGPGILTAIMRKVCGIEDLEMMTPSRCGGVTVLEQKHLYAINWRQVNWFFDEKFSLKVEEALSESYVAHFWNKHSSQYTIIPGSQQPILKLAARNCPKTFSTYFNSTE